MRRRSRGHGREEWTGRSCAAPRGARRPRLARSEGGERRRTPRLGALKRAQIVAGDTVLDCVVLNITEGGARVRTAAAAALPERVELRLAGGGAFPAVRRWARGAEAGFEFAAGASLRGRAAAQAWSAYEALRGGRLDEAVRLLRAERFFDDEGLRRAAEEAEAARARLEAILREQAQGS